MTDGAPVSATGSTPGSAQSPAQTSAQSSAQGSKAGRYLRFLGLAFVLVLVLGAIGFVPTRRLAGADGPLAMIAGCGISLVSAAAAGYLLVVIDGTDPNIRLQRAGLAMIVRPAVALGLGIAAALSGEFSRMPLLFWVATTYVVVLPLEVRLAIQ